MSATGLLSDDAIEAIVHDRPLDPALAPLATFAREVRGLGDGPAPRPSSELAVLLGGGTTAELELGLGFDLGRTAPLPVVDTDDPTERLGVVHARHAQRTRSVGRGRAAKVALGLSLTAAGVAGAGAVGILPAAANDAVRSAIEAVSPVHFSDRGDEPTTSSDDRVPESPGTTGDDAGAGTGEGTTIADGAKGADHRPDPSAADEPPGQSGDTGLARANETPAEPHAPETTPAATAPSTIPAHGRPDEAGKGNP